MKCEKINLLRGNCFKFQVFVIAASSSYVISHANVAFGTKTPKQHKDSFAFPTHIEFSLC